MDVQGTAEATCLYRPVSGIGLQIPLLRHAHFDMQPTGIVAPVEVDPPVSGHSRDKLNFITILPGIDPKVLAQFVALIFHAKLNLLGVPGSYSHAAIIGLHTYIRSPRNRKGLGDFLGARGLGQGEPGSQGGRAGESQTSGVCSVQKSFHLQFLRNTLCRSARRYAASKPNVPFREAMLSTIGIAVAAIEAYHSRKSGVGVSNLTYKRRRNYEEIFGSGGFGGPWPYRFPGNPVTRTTKRKRVARFGAEDRGVLGNHGFCEDRALLCRRWRPHLFRPCSSEVQQLGRVSGRRAKGALRRQYQYQSQNERRPARTFE